MRQSGTKIYWKKLYVKIVFTQQVHCRLKTWKSRNRDESNVQLHRCQLVWAGLPILLYFDFLWPEHIKFWQVQMINLNVVNAEKLAVQPIELVEFGLRMQQYELRAKIATGWQRYKETATFGADAAWWMIKSDENVDNVAAAAAAEADVVCYINRVWRRCIYLQMNWMPGASRFRTQEA